MNLIHYINGNINKSYENINYKFDVLSKKYNFFLDNIENNIYITDRLIFIRESDEYIFSLEIGDKSIGHIKMKNDNYEFDLDVENAEYKNQKGQIEFTYKISGDEEQHKVVIKVDE